MSSVGMMNKNPDQRPKSGTLIGLGIVLLFEALALAILSVWFLIEILTTEVNSIPGSILTLALAVLATVWVAAAGVGAFRARPWVRAAALTWQLCQLAIAVGTFDGIFAQPQIGYAVLVPTVLALVLLFMPSTTAALRRDEND